VSFFDSFIANFDLKKYKKLEKTVKFLENLIPLNIGQLLKDYIEDNYQPHQEQHQNYVKLNDKSIYTMIVKLGNSN
jgi:hypothetical protein